MNKIIIDMNCKCSFCGKPGVYKTEDGKGKVCGKCLLKRLDKLFENMDKEEKESERK